MGRGRKIGIVLFVMLLLLVGLVVIADRVGAGVAEDRIADQAEAELQRAGATTAGRPAVDIDGFPFITQVLGGQYDRITITADRPKSGDILLERMTIVATDVKAAASDLLNGRGPVTAGRLTGTAAMNWDTVRSMIQLANLPVPFDPAQLEIKVVDNRVELRLPLSLAGVTTTLRANGTVDVANGRIRLQLTDVSTEGAALTGAAKTLFDRFRNQLSATIRTPQMPYTLVLRSVQSTSSGIDVTATADNIKLMA